VAGEARSVVVRLTAETAQYISQMQAAGAMTAGAMTKAEAATMRQSQAYDTLGSKAGKAGLAAALGLAAMGKAAVDWESQFAGVEKTVDGTASELGVLEGELRGLAKTMPATHEEIAGVAEAAGQLGVAREDISEFTETMVQLGETTNLTAQDAATSIAQMANVMGTAPDQIDNLASSLVAAGNAGASTERQIIEMAQGISGAAAVVGLAESDVIGIANAVASAGIEVEAGGSSISRVLTDMAKATAQGGDDLEAFAEVAGVSAEEFARSFKERPAEALTTFIAGLGRMSASGEDVFTVLDQLGLSDVRVSRALLSMAADSDKFAASLELAGDAWDENTALVDEFAKRLGTSAADVQIAWNNIKDAGIEAGQVLLPVVSQVADVVSDLAGAFNKLPGPVKSAATGLLGITAILGGGLWFGSKVIGGITSTSGALADLAVTSPRAASGLSAVAKAGIALAAIEGTTLILKELTDQFKTPIDTSTLTRDLQALTDGRITGGLEDLGIWLGDIGDKWERDWNPIARLTPLDMSGFEDAERGLGEIDKALAGWVESGNADQAAALFDVILQKAKESGTSTDVVTAAFGEYATALDNAAAAEQRASQSDTLAGLLDVTGDAAAGAADSFDELTGAAGSASAAMAQLTGHLDREAAVRAYGDAVRETADALKDGFQPEDVETIASMGREIANVTETLESKPGQQRSKLKEAKADLEAFMASNPKAKAEFADLLKYVNRGLDALDNTEASPDIGLDDSEFRGGAEAVRRQTKALNFLKAHPEVDLEDAVFQMRFGLTQRDLAWLNGAKATAELYADASGVSRGIGLARAMLNSIDGTTVTTYIATRHLPANNAAGGMLALPGAQTREIPR
jgi:TP901 family phage tail tape measure protein